MVKLLIPGNFGIAMKPDGYESFYSNKSDSPEGVCLFWKRAEFELIEKRDYPINGALLDKEDALFTDLQQAVLTCKPNKTPHSKETKITTENDTKEDQDEKQGKKVGSTQPKVSRKYCNLFFIK